MNTNSTTTRICKHCPLSFLDYMYGTWWKCRKCDAWASIAPAPGTAR